MVITDIEATGNPSFQYLAAILADLALLTDGMHYGWPSPTLPQILNNTNSTLCISQDQGLWLAVMPLLGSTIGALIAANIVDCFGRRKTILATAIPFFTAWFMVAAATSPVWLYIARFIAGVADGVSFTVVPMYIGEIADATVRGMLGSSCSVMWIVGFLLINIIGSYLSISNTAIVSSLVPICALVTFFWMPESPYYLIMKERIDEAQSSLRKLRRTEKVDDELERMRTSIQSKNKNTGRILDLFSIKSNRKALFIVTGLRGFQQFSGTTAITFYAQTIFKEAGDDISPHHASMIYFSVQLLVTILSSSLVDKAGRKPLLIVSMIGTAIALFLEGTYFYVKTETDIDTSSFGYVPVIVLIVFVIVFSLGMQSIPLLILGEMFPTSVKAYALCLADIHYSIMASIASKFLQITKDKYGMFVTFFGFTIFSIMGLIFIILVVPETKGKNLEEIQDLLKGKIPHDHSKCDEEECVKV
ncbi:unnamed protein product [Phaedon cochleariae]|uniref:Major facilitator superfamily (MFS) profile domain-containing protein n=1 Tax=Phaedon cochleariae TaxID=80249 RepID=A0A9P0GM93_PHACE|nr:unnamed protein product [Phaedon cochleariae]